jgi:hypothetical protein
LDEATETFLAELEGAPTDLARLVRRAIEKRAPALVISAEAVMGWEARASDTWTKARRWLAARGMRVVLVESDGACVRERTLAATLTDIRRLD